MTYRNNIADIGIHEACRLFPGGPHIDDDLLLFNDVSDVLLPHQPCRMRCLFVAMCTSGRASYTIDTDRHEVTAGDIIIISNGQVASDFTFSDDCHGTALMLSDAFFNSTIEGIHDISSLYLFARQHPVYRLTAGELGTLTSYLTIIRQRVEDTTHRFRRDTVRMLIATMILDLSNVIYRERESMAAKTRAEDIFTHFIALVRDNFRNERRVSWYSLQIGISPKYLSETVGQVSHRTPNEWIDYYVVQEIKVMLRNSTAPIKEITASLHFPNQSFFGRYFKEHVGMSPSEYRKRK